MNAVFQFVAAVKPPETLADRFSLSGTVLLEGMLVIFCVLALLWGAIEVLHALLNHEKAKAEPSEASASAPRMSAPPSTPSNVQTPAVGAATDDGAIVAAIIAAISAARAEEGYTGGFRVVSFQRASSRKNRF